MAPSHFALELHLNMNQISGLNPARAHNSKSPILGPMPTLSADNFPASTIYENSQWNSKNQSGKSVNRIMHKKLEDQLVSNQGGFNHTYNLLEELNDWKSLDQWLEALDRVLNEDGRKLVADEVQPGDYCTMTDYTYSSDSKNV
ncbi:hypothetical protein IEQ34_018618 [Dendrobium chrysotoxum]|uniref:Uncharacterized protein n=1 Tax=Dendrobium chrysotoxum TaxID=161865 RepID=A0AAV7FNZ7_DENCH|nr:hypothetical protein IEQ34_018618 [Dendrobium chrysotoxum]